MGADTRKEGALMSATTTVISTILVKWLIRLGRQVNKGAFHRYAEELKKKDREAGYDNYKNT